VKLYSERHGEIEVEYPWSDETMVGALDPGAPGSVTNGIVTANMVRMFDWYTKSVSGMGLPEMFGIFLQDPHALPGVIYGDTITYAWPGGFDIGAFSGQAPAPAQLEITSPVITTQNCYSTVQLDLDKDLRLQWNPAEPGDFVLVQIESGAYNEGTGQFTRGVVICMLVDDGDHTIAGDLLRQLPRGREGNATFRATRYNARLVPVPLVQTGGTGYVDLLCGSQVTAYGGLPSR